MNHAGKVFAAIQLMFGGSRNVKGNVTGFGDELQISWLNRTEELIAYEILTEKLIASKEFLKDSWRCPQDVLVKVMSRYANHYRAQVTTYSTVEHSIKVIPIRVVEEIPVVVGNGEGDVLYLTFTHAEQSAVVSFLRNSGVQVAQSSRDVMTGRFVRCHVPEEIQGRTYKTVIAVRASAANSIAYASPTHNLVAVTRHTHRLEYYCVSGSGDNFRDMLDVPVSDVSLSVVRNTDNVSHTRGKCAMRGCGFNEL
jgi:hypothetical protein